MVALNELPLGLLAFTGKAPPRGRSGTSAPYGAFRTLDGWVNIAVGGDPIWARFCQAMGRPDLVSEPRFAAARSRVSNFEDLDRLVSDWTASMTSDAVTAALLAVHVPCAPIFNLDQVMASPQVAARDMLITIEDPIAGPVRVVGNPIKMSGIDEAAAVRPPPILASDTERVLREIGGLTAEAIDHLRQTGIVGVA